jgi:hypothetical protein
MLSQKYLSGVIVPTIKRTDFKNTSNSPALVNYQIKKTI